MIKDKTKQRSANYKCKYGVTLEDYVSMYIAQRGVCAICGTSDCPNGDYEASARLERPPHVNSLVIDHDHCTGRVRGLVHRKCNAGIGLIKDDVAVLRGAIAYLNKFKTP